MASAVSAMAASTMGKVSTFHTPWVLKAWVMAVSPSKEPAWPKLSTEATVLIERNSARETTSLRSETSTAGCTRV